MLKVDRNKEKDHHSSHKNQSKITHGKTIMSHDKPKRLFKYQIFNDKPENDKQLFLMKKASISKVKQYEKENRAINQNTPKL